VYTVQSIICGTAKNLSSALCDVTHDGWFCTFTMKQQLEIPSARTAGQLLSGQLVRYGKAGGTARTKSQLPDHSPPADEAGRRVGPSL
jgi:hypothetical protein